MLKHPDHVTIVVTDVKSSRAFFELLGFKVTVEAVIKGDIMSRYMGIPNIEADHITMALPGSNPHFEIQLLHYHTPEVESDPRLHNLARVGYNHLCFAVDNIEDVARRLTAAGVTFRNELMTFHDRKLLFIEGPEQITLELAEWA